MGRRALFRRYKHDLSTLLVKSGAETFNPLSISDPEIQARGHRGKGTTPQAWIPVETLIRRLRQQRVFSTGVPEDDPSVAKNPSYSTIAGRHRIHTGVSERTIADSTSQSGAPLPTVLQKLGFQSLDLEMFRLLRMYLRIFVNFERFR